jgi:hypothetical protein|tara:strand:+ start:1418 stop:2683 length:1266 start_codon:yes stop_codon:yes gene_type:complete
MSRNYTDFIQASADAIKGSPIPKPFAQWSALSAVAGAMGRRVWYSMANYDIRSNNFIVLIAPPGRNKSVSLILPFTKVFSRLTTPVGTTEDDQNFNSGLDQYGLRNYPLYVVQDRITPEKLAVDMTKITRLDLRLSTPAMDEFYDSSVTLVTSEFGTFMGRHERYLQMFMTDMWDSKAEYSHKTKTSGEYIIKGPCLNWLACATPEQFVDNLPEDARSQGLLSRMLPIYYDGDRIPQSLVQERVSDNTVNNLREDLADIAKMYGPMTFDEDAFKIVDEDIKAGIPPEPTDNHLSEYVQRRVSHFIKIAIAVSASRRSTRKIMLEDWEFTKELLFAAEKQMPKALEGFGMGRTGRIAHDMVTWLHGTLFNNGRSHMLLKLFKRELLRKIPNPGELEQTIKAMEDSGYIKVEGNVVFPCRKDA